MYRLEQVSPEDMALSFDYIILIYVVSQPPHNGSIKHEPNRGWSPVSEFMSFDERALARELLLHPKTASPRNFSWNGEGQRW